MKLSPDTITDLRLVVDRLTEGNFYEDYDEASRLLGVLRDHVDSLTPDDGPMVNVVSSEPGLITPLGEDRSIAICPVQTDDGVLRWAVVTTNKGSEISLIYSTEAMMALVLMFYEMAEQRALAEESLNDLGNNPAMQRQMDALAEQHDAAVEAEEA